MAEHDQVVLALSELVGYFDLRVEVFHLLLVDQLLSLGLQDLLLLLLPELHPEELSRLLDDLFFDAQFHFFLF